MARRPATPPASLPAQLSTEQMRAGIARLNKRIEEIQAFDPNQVDQRRHGEVPIGTIRQAVQRSKENAIATLQQAARSLDE
jgi:hypothetical protein